MARDLVCSAVLLGLAAGYYVLAAGIGRSALSDEVGPGGLPILYAAILASLAVAQAVTTILRSRFSDVSRPGGRSYKGSASSKKVRGLSKDVGATASSRFLSDVSRPGGRSYKGSASSKKVRGLSKDVGATASSRFLSDVSRPGGRSYKGSASSNKVGGQEKDAQPLTAVLRRAAGVLAIGVGYLLLVPYTGYVLGLVLVISSTAIYFGERSLGRALLISVAGAGVFWLLFVLLLGIPMPALWGS